MTALFGFLLGSLVRLWAWTWRRSVVWKREQAGSAVFAFWHGRQMALVGTAENPLCVMVSHSKDGTLQSGVMRALGISVVRGSSSRGGASAYRALLRALRGGSDLGFAVDGPRGPRGTPKLGAARAASRANAALIPVGSAASRSFHLSSWDDFELPLPFARVVVVAGEPVDAARAASDPSVLGRAIEQAEARARREILEAA